MQRSWVASPQYRHLIAALKAVRTEHNVSQRELARRLQKPPSFVNKIELLERRLDILEFVMIARALELPADELLRLISASLGD
ncbi:helix-turn-helix domain-containing protein [Sphingomonas tabacisoli]|uniref:Helix-turn-helix domain-containing protein n=1 Tax=Sphingomonas tabacisoli TaxID=2249466 RepID=A0ABW4I3S7_9SPHN